MPLCSSAQIWSRRVGRSSSRCSMRGRPCHPSVFRIMPQEVGGRKKLTRCWRGMGEHGARLKKSSCHLRPARFPLPYGKRLPVCSKTVAGNREVVILPDAKGIAHTAAAEFLTAAREAVLERNSFSVALAGGSTPKALYGLLSTNALVQALVPWSKIQWFFGDERHVGPDDPDSNFRMASET